MATSFKNNGHSFMHPGLVANLQEALVSRKAKEEDPSGKMNEDSIKPSSSSSSSVPDTLENDAERDPSPKPVLLITNCSGIDCPGLTHLVDALVKEDLYTVHICVPKSDKYLSGHSITYQETVAAVSTEINGAPAFEVSGTPADCVSLALSGALFSWSTPPALVISGINRGSNCGNQAFYSGAVGGAREALICGVPSISLSLNCKDGDSQENDFQSSVSICLPLIHAAVRDITQGSFPSCCMLRVEIPSPPPPLPPSIKGFKVTEQSSWRRSPTWQAASNSRIPVAGKYLSNQQSLGIQLAQLSRDASAAGAARRVVSEKKSLEIESVGVAGKQKTEGQKKYFRMEFSSKEVEDMGDSLDFRAVEDGFVAVTPLFLPPVRKSEALQSVSEWISRVSVDK